MGKVYTFPYCFLRHQNMNPVIMICSKRQLVIFIDLLTIFLCFSVSGTGSGTTKPTQKHTEKPTDKPTQPPTEPPAEAPTEPPVSSPYIYPFDPYVIEQDMISYGISQGLTYDSSLTFGNCGYNAPDELNNYFDSLIK